VLVRGKPPLCPHLVARWQDRRTAGLSKNHALLAIVRDADLEHLLKRMQDQEEFLSDYGIRSLSRYHQAHPYALDTYPDEDRHQAPSLLHIHPLSLQNVAEQLGE
jgi:hypothetical protein